MTCTPGEEYVMSRCELPNCPNIDKDVPTIVVDIGDDAGGPHDTYSSAGRSPLSGGSYIRNIKRI